MSRIVFSPDGQYLAGVSVGKDGVNSIIIRDADTGKQQTALPSGDVCAFSPNGKLMAVGYRLERKQLEGDEDQPGVRVWEWATGKEVAAFPDGALSPLYRIHQSSVNCPVNLFRTGFGPPPRNGL